MVKVRWVTTCYIALLTRVNTRGQKHFTILEMATIRHELMMPQHTMRPSAGGAVVVAGKWLVM